MAQDPNLLDEMPETAALTVTVVGEVVDETGIGETYIRVRCDRPGERAVSLVVRLAQFDDAVSQAMVTHQAQRVPESHPPARPEEAA